MGCLSSKIAPPVNPDEMSDAEKKALCLSVTFKSVHTGNTETMLVSKIHRFKEPQPKDADDGAPFGGWGEVVVRKLLNSEGFFGVKFPYPSPLHTH